MHTDKIMRDNRLTIFFCFEDQNYNYSNFTKVTFLQIFSYTSQIRIKCSEEDFNNMYIDLLST